MRYSRWILKRKIEHILLLPFIITGRVLQRMAGNQTRHYDCYFFFPFYHTGGAEYVHAQIVQVLKHRLKGKIYFTRRSHNDQYRSLFENSGWDITDLSKWTDHKLWYFTNLIMRGFISTRINLDSSVRFVFNGQSNFGYKISPWIKKSIPQYELIHSYNSFSAIRIPYIEYYTKTVMIAQSRIEDHFRQYERLQVPRRFYANIELIQNAVTAPAQNGNRNRKTAPLKVLYAGRGTREKRVHLIAAIAQKLEKDGILFGFAGDVQAALPKNISSNIQLYGNINDPKKLEQIYQQHDILILTSSTEGMPIVIQEAMMNGLAVIGTPVGDIPLEIENYINGFVLSSPDKETQIIEEAVSKIRQLNEDRELLMEMSYTNMEKAYQKFGLHTFQKKYERLFNIS